MLKKSLMALSIATAMALGSAANAATVSTTGGVYDFSWSYDTGATIGSDALILSGSGSMTATANGSVLTLAVTLTNNANVSNQRLMSFGFGISPDAISATSITSDWNAGLDSIPSLQAIEICAWDSNNCNGGNINNGLAEGATETFTLQLGGTWGSSVDINPLGFKYQGEPGSYEFTSEPPPEVPVPGTLGLLGLGLAGLGLVRRNQKS